MSPVGHGAVGSLEKPHLAQGRESRLQLIPDPDRDVFRGGVFENIVDVSVVEAIQDPLLDDPLQKEEVEGHPGAGIHRHLQRDVKLVAVAVQIATGAVVARKLVGGLESETLRENHAGAPLSAGRARSRQEQTRFNPSDASAPLLSTSRDRAPALLAPSPSSERRSPTWSICPTSTPARSATA